MPFFIETFDRPASHALRQALRPAHLAFLEGIAPKLLACGAKLSDDGETAEGGVYLVDVETREEAEALIAADPFFTGGLFQETRVCRWRKGYLDGQAFL
jgi:uncharacterized protein YciI